MSGAGLSFVLPSSSGEVIKIGVGAGEGRGMGLDLGVGCPCLVPSPPPPPPPSPPSGNELSDPGSEPSPIELMLVMLVKISATTFEAAGLISVGLEPVVSFAGAGRRFSSSSLLCCKLNLLSLMLLGSASFSILSEELLTTEVSSSMDTPTSGMNVHSAMTCLSNTLFFSSKMIFCTLASSWSLSYTLFPAERCLSMPPFFKIMSVLAPERLGWKVLPSNSSFSLLFSRRVCFLLMSSFETANLSSSGLCSSNSAPRDNL
mmetsp:Transcript_27651/g.52388  ORF Transcript_27651/g.52388 Transcript_27651/m.52388 type:complete len:260 (-) Transcript_27651:166-945(-)